MRRRAVGVAAVAAGAVLLAGCTAVPAAESSTDSPPPGTAVEMRIAQRVTQVSEVHEERGSTLLEGPTFAPNGSLYMVDVVAPAGAAKVLRLDLDTQEVEHVYTDDASALTSAQFGPLDGRLYLTDFAGGAIRSVTPEGDDPRVVFEGPVDGVTMRPDDLSFDAAGNMIVTDSQGYADPGWDASGRLVRVDAVTGQASALAGELAAPNGIAFTPDSLGVWVSQNTGNRIDFLRLGEGSAEVATAYPGMYPELGTGQIDSLAVDAAGNIYAGIHGQPTMLVYGHDGGLKAKVTVPEADAAGLSSATNVAIEPGTTDAYMTVSGTDGGFVYRFTAWGEGTRQSNGG